MHLTEMKINEYRFKIMTEQKEREREGAAIKDFVVYMSSHV